MFEKQISVYKFGPLKYFNFQQNTLGIGSKQNVDNHDISGMQRQLDEYQIRMGGEWWRGVPKQANNQVRATARAVPHNSRTGRLVAAGAALIET